MGPKGNKSNVCIYNTKCIIICKWEQQHSVKVVFVDHIVLFVGLFETNNLSAVPNDAKHLQCTLQEETIIVQAVSYMKVLEAAFFIYSK